MMFSGETVYLNYTEICRMLDSVADGKCSIGDGDGLILRCKLRRDEADMADLLYNKFASVTEKMIKKSITELAEKTDAAADRGDVADALCATEYFLSDIERVLLYRICSALNHERKKSLDADVSEIYASFIADAEKKQDERIFSPDDIYRLEHIKYTIYKLFPELRKRI